MGTLLRLVPNSDFKCCGFVLIEKFCLYFFLSLFCLRTFLF